MSEQQINDARKHGISLLLFAEHSWLSFLGRMIHEDCRISLKRPMKFLETLEKCGKIAEKEGRFLSWIVPITNFPVVQHYTEGVVRKRYIQYGPPKGPRKSTGYFENTLQLAVCFIEDKLPSRGKQAQGASPNAIHSLDAAHLMLVTTRAPFPVTTIHDSYGCLLADMPQLFTIVRETFVELYEANPLERLMQDVGGTFNDVGTLDITLVKDSEYAFL